MLASSIQANGDLIERVETVATLQPRTRRIVACIDASHYSRQVIPHSVSIANALDAELILMHVLETKPKNGKLLDPVEWDLQRQEAYTLMRDLAQERVKEVERIRFKVVEGRAADQICTWARDNQVDLTVLSTHENRNASEWDLGSTVRRIIDCISGSVLLVPATVEESEIVQYRRLFVPLDGSSRAECALPLALRLATAHGAEILLVHAVPEPGLTEIGPLEPEDLELRARLLHRNERVAQEYLDRIRAHITARGISIRTLLLRGGDARHLLYRTIVDEAADLAILASHGHSGHVDVPAGSVAAYLIGHTPIPLLVVCDQAATLKGRRRTPPVQTDIRLPNRAAS